MNSVTYAIAFYSSVILNSTETRQHTSREPRTFYSSVILNSTETKLFQAMPELMFYSSVILYLNC